MPKPAQRPVPPDHRVYPRGMTPKAEPKAAANGHRPAQPIWARAVPPDRTFPRS